MTKIDGRTKKSAAKQIEESLNLGGFGPVPGCTVLMTCSKIIIPDSAVEF